MRFKIPFLSCLICLCQCTLLLAQKAHLQTVSTLSYRLPRLPPEAPTHLVIKDIYQGKVHLQWQDNSDNERTFRIEMSIGDNQNFKQITTTHFDVEDYVVSGLEPNKTYYFRVRAYNFDFSDYTNEASVTMPTIPAAPTHLTARRFLNGKIRLSWQYSSNDEEGFVIERWTQSQEKITITSVAKGVREFYDDTYESGTPYHYEIKAIKNNIYSMVASFPVVNTPAVPPAPYSLKVIRTDDTKALISWGTASDVSKFLVERSTHKNFGYALIKEINGKERSFTDEAINTSSPFFYRVRAFSPYTGFSRYSNIARVNTHWGKWEVKTPFTNHNFSSRVKGFRLGKYGYVVSSTNMWQYDTETNTWTSITFSGAIPSPKHCFAIQGKGYIVSEGTTLKIYEYDPNTSIWTLKPPASPDFDYVMVKPFVLNNKLYCAFRLNDGEIRMTAYDPGSNSWATLGPTPPVYSRPIASFTIGYYGYVILTDRSESKRYFGQYDAITDKFTSLGSFPQDVNENSKFFNYEDKAYVLTENNFYCYLPASNEWRTLPPLPGTNSLIFDFDFIIKGKLYTGPHSQNNTWAFTPNNTDFTLYRPTMNNLVLENSHQMKVSWVDHSDAETGFSIFRKEGYHGAFKEVAQVGSNVTTYTDQTVQTGKVYFYKVKTLQTTQRSMFSDIVFLLNPGLPSAPQQLTGELEGFIKHPVAYAQKTLTKLQWEDLSDDEQSFEIERSLGDNQNYVKVASVANNVTNYYDSFDMPRNLAPYVYYRVKAVNSLGSSSYSNEYVVIAAGDYGGKWVRKEDIPVGGLGANYEIGIYIGAGMQFNGKGHAIYDRWVMEYDPMGDSWKQIGDFPGPRRKGILGVKVNNKGYVGSTQDGVPNKDMWEYTQVGNQLNWTQKNDVTFSRSGWVAQVTIENYAYLLLSEDDKVVLHKFDPIKDEWTDEVKCPGVGSEALFAIGNNIYLILEEPAKQLWVYNLKQKHWKRLKDFPGNLATGLTTFTINHHGYVGLGDQTATMWQYDTRRDTWQRIDNGPARRRLTNFVIDKKAYVVGGYNTYFSDASQELYAYIPGITPPKNLAATPQVSQIKLTWQDVSDEEKAFKIERAVGQSLNFTEIAQVNANLESFIDTQVQVGQTYFYRVSVAKEEMQSYSNLAQAIIVANNTLNTPTNLVTSSLTPTQVALQWTDNNTKETAYEIYRAQTSGTFEKIGEVEANVITYQDVLIQEGQTYQYKVLARNEAGISLFSNELIVNVPTATPQAPTQLFSTSISDQEVNLTWTDNSDNEQAFEIYRATNFSNSYSKIGEVTQNRTSFTDRSNLTPGQAYNYKVLARNSVGNSPFSNTFRARIPTTPQTPDQLTVGAVSQRTVDLSWRDNSFDEQTFEIHRSLSPTSGFRRVGIVSANHTSFTNQSLQSNTTYFYKVLATNAGLVSTFSNRVQVHTLPNPPASPESLKASIIANIMVEITWADKANNETGFEVYRSTTQGSNFSKIAEVNANTVIYIDQTVVANTTYYYKVLAKNQGGSSSFSNEISAEITLPIPEAPQQLKASQITQNEVQLQWEDHSSNESVFEIYQIQDKGSSRTKIGEVGTNVTTFQVANLTSEKEYKFVVLAKNLAGKSTTSNILTITTLPEKPLAPTNLALSEAKSNAITLIWQDNASNETTFEIYRTQTAGSGHAKVGEVNTDVTTFQDIQVMPGNTYEYVVLAKNVAGESTYSNALSVTTLPEKPVAPTDLAIVDKKGTEVTLTWKDHSSNEEAFEIYRSSTSGAGFTKVGEVLTDQVHFINNNLQEGQNYYYKIRARNAGGYSNFSQEIEVHINSPAPINPSKLVIQAFPGAELKLEWQDNADNEAGFVVYRSTSNPNQRIIDRMEKVAELPINSTSFTDQNLQPKTTYYYAVLALNVQSQALTPQAEVVKAVTLPFLPNQPINITGKRISATQISLTWQDQSDNETGFIMERSVGNMDNFTFIHKTGTDISQFVDENTIANQRYYYRIKAVNESGDSDYSMITEVDITTGINQHPHIDQLSFEVTPNPVIEKLNISFYLQQREQVQLRLVNQQGKVVKQQNLGVQQGKVKYQLSVTNIPAGKLVLQLITPSGHITYKLIKY